jgi:hypothetical protein
MQINYVEYRTYLDGLNPNWIADRPSLRCREWSNGTYILPERTLRIARVPSKRSNSFLETP